MLNYKKMQILKDLKSTSTLGAYNFWNNLDQIAKMVNLVSLSKSQENSEEHHSDFLNTFEQLIKKDVSTFQKSLLENQDPKNLATALQFK